MQTETLKDEVKIEKKEEDRFLLIRNTEQIVNSKFILQAEQQHKGNAQRLKASIDSISMNYETMRKDLAQKEWAGKDLAKKFMEYMRGKANLGHLDRELAMERKNLGQFIKPASEARKFLKIDELEEKRRKK